ncbi:protein OXIDATIVE STRESS 3 LIKE 1-like [Cornus florida]|uniref:protein OXIDATIVE STRESS 3 LIKE 1-like n=1 Tax=Cornus florida TaxID=4283 RepID=UPI00289FF6E2|nr:protein OXIDATIVE STRESS 3 LIKE 1-like [Cornus florida]
MSIALESNPGNRIERSGFVHGMTFAPIYDSPEARRQVNGILAGDRLLPVGTTTAKNKVKELKEELETSSSSSIGRNSDSSGGEPDGDGDSGEGEVQSSYKGSLDTMESLEEVLPIKRGISKFYCGKSKSFTSLADASTCSSIKDIAKLENAYTRKRKNLLAHNIFFDKNHNSPLRSGMSKRAANSNRSTSNLANMGSFECNNKSEHSNSNSSSPTLSLPPLYPHGRRPPNNESPSSPPPRNFSSWRSFSLSDLQCAAAAAASPSITGLVVSKGDKESELH